MDTTIPVENVDFMIDRLGVHLESENDIVVEYTTRAVKKLFEILDYKHKEVIVNRWLGSKQRDTRNFSSKGRISALGVVASLFDLTLQQRVVIQLQEFVTGSWSVEIKTMALKSLADAQVDAGNWASNHSTYNADSSIGCNHFLADMEPFEVLRIGLSDYTTDQRGDIGSLARLEAIQYCKVILEAWPGVRFNHVHTRDIITLLAKLAAEKLDKVRYQAWTCLVLWWQNYDMIKWLKEDDDQDDPESRNNDWPLPNPISYHINHMIETSSEPYFAQLLTLCHIPWLRPSLLQGLISSACQGTESIIRTSRAALVKFILSNTTTTNDANLGMLIYTDILNLLAQTLTNDRYALPALEILGFLLTQNLVSFSSSSSSTTTTTSFSTKADPTSTFSPSPTTTPPNLFRKTFLLLQKSHFKSTSIPRLDSALRLYEGLLVVAAPQALRRDIHKKMVGMLGHPYPKVRTGFAEVLFFSLLCDNDDAVDDDGGKGDGVEGRKKALEKLRMTDWTGALGRVKRVAEEMKIDLGI